MKAIGFVIYLPVSFLLQKTIFHHQNMTGAKLPNPLEDRLAVETELEVR
jgi:hypothetical protein